MFERVYCTHRNGSLQFGWPLGGRHSFIILNQASLHGTAHVKSAPTNWRLLINVLVAAAWQWKRKGVKAAIFALWPEMAQRVEKGVIANVKVPLVGKFNKLVPKDAPQVYPAQKESPLSHVNLSFSMVPIHVNVNTSQIWAKFTTHRFSNLIYLRLIVKNKSTPFANEILYVFWIRESKSSPMALYVDCWETTLTVDDRILIFWERLLTETTVTFQKICQNIVRSIH